MYLTDIPRSKKRLKYIISTKQYTLTTDKATFYLNKGHMNLLEANRNSMVAFMIKVLFVSSNEQSL